MIILMGSNPILSPKKRWKKRKTNKGKKREKELNQVSRTKDRKKIRVRIRNGKVITRARAKGEPSIYK